MVITSKGMLLRIQVAGIGTLGRATQGVRVIQIDEEDLVVAVAKLAEKHEVDEEPNLKREGDA
jgi:DNA gyrase subunit A